MHILDASNHGRPLILFMTHVVLVRVACGSNIRTELVVQPGGVRNFIIPPNKVTNKLCEAESEARIRSGPTRGPTSAYSQGWHDICSPSEDFCSFKDSYHTRSHLPPALQQRLRGAGGATRVVLLPESGLPHPEVCASHHPDFVLCSLNHAQG